MGVKKLAKDVIDKVLFPNQSWYATYLYNLKGLNSNSEFISFPEFITATFELAKDVPSDIDVVIGIPRHGLLVASIMGIYLGKPIATPDQFLDGGYWGSFYTKGKPLEINQIRTALLVDDCVGTGRQIKATKERLMKFYPKLKVLTAAPYVLPKIAKDIDYYKFSKPTFFEIDLVDEFDDGTIGTDIDGVLCEEPTKEQEKDIRTFYKTAKPYRIPIVCLKFIVTARLEKYREVTEIWLKKHNVLYDKLIMRQSEEQSPRATKLKAIRKYKPDIFWESDPILSEQLYLLTGCRTLCFNNMYYYGGKRKVLS
jgi:hypoxanthine phosphoribosyltransferase